MKRYGQLSKSKNSLNSTPPDKFEPNFILLSRQGSEENEVARMHIEENVTQHHPGDAQTTSDSMTKDQDVTDWNRGDNSITKTTKMNDGIEAFSHTQNLKDSLNVDLNKVDSDRVIAERDDNAVEGTENSKDQSLNETSKLHELVEELVVAKTESSKHHRSKP